MKLNIFNKKETDKKKNAHDETAVEEQLEQDDKKIVSSLPLEKLAGAQGGFSVLKSFYISEKASDLLGINQYVFKVYDSTTKNEIKKQVENLFNVKVKHVRIINLPKKRRDIGKHPGFKAGFRKAIVALKDGYSIEQAKA